METICEVRITSLGCGHDCNKGRIHKEKEYRVEKDEFGTTLYIAPRTGPQGKRRDLECIFTFQQCYMEKMQRGEDKTWQELQLLRVELLIPRSTEVTAYPIQHVNRPKRGMLFENQCKDMSSFWQRRN